MFLLLLMALVSLLIQPMEATFLFGYKMILEGISWNNYWIMKKNFNFVMRYNFKSYPQLQKKKMYFTNLMKQKCRGEESHPQNQTLLPGILIYLHVANIWVSVVFQAQFLVLGNIAVNKTKSASNLVPVCVCACTYADTPTLKRKNENGLVLCTLFCNLRFFLLAIY